VDIVLVAFALESGESLIQTCKTALSREIAWSTMAAGIGLLVNVVNTADKDETNRVVVNAMIAEISAGYDPVEWGACLTVSSSSGTFIFHRRDQDGC
jgi:hypothetical protein